MPMSDRSIALYTDEDGRRVSTHSMIKTFRRCPKQAQYKYIDRLKPKRLSKQLRRGSWIHSLLETYYKGGDWREPHTELSKRFNQMFDEEKAEMGDLPREIEKLMVSYFWHYGQADWRVHEIEFTLEANLPDGGIYRGKIDLLVEDQYGLWIVDHKSHARLPDTTYRILDAQSALYVWAAWQNKIPVQGHIWNYIRTKPPTTPQILKKGGISIRQIETDYPTYYRFLKKHGFPLEDHRDKLDYLKGQRYQHGAMQTSPFFRRDVLEKDSRLLLQVAQEAYATHKRMHSYDFSDDRRVERNPDRSCSFSCSYTDLCTVELFGGNPDQVRRSRYRVGDPMDYYYDQDSRVENAGDK